MYAGLSQKLLRNGTNLNVSGCRTPKVPIWLRYPWEMFEKLTFCTNTWHHSKEIRVINCQWCECYGWSVKRFGHMFLTNITVQQLQVGSSQSMTNVSHRRLHQWEWGGEACKMPPTTFYTVWWQLSACPSPVPFARPSEPTTKVIYMKIKIGWGGVNLQL